ncbi:MAG: hypothetical protein WCS96_12065 [Victivallales bacterium]
MSISVSSYNYSGPRKRKGRATEENRLKLFATTLKISIPFCILFAAAIVRVMWTSQSETLNKETISLENRISDIERETDNLNIMIEQQSGKNILAQVKRYNLDLHYPHPGQIRKLECMSKIKKVETAVKQPSNPKPIMVTQGNGVRNPESASKYYR